MARRYRDAAAKLQQNVQKHLKEMKDLSSSEDEEPYEASVIDGMFQSYWRGGGDTQVLNRTKNLLEEAISGRSVTCLICIASIRRNHAIWTCDYCYSYFHFSCIQKWANDSVSMLTDFAPIPDISIYKPQKVEWCCPKCRHSYSKEEIPRKYTCFCGKTDNPPVHPWLIPHTCGEVCGKRLSEGDNCKHKCLLLCHPGPCPPCPQTVDGICYCQKERKKVRCSAAKWSCGQKCQEKLLCQVHECELLCHDGKCPPCTHTSMQSCDCGAHKVLRLCSDPFWHCTKPCNKPFSCSYHKCEVLCHSGSCGDCPNSGMKSCPCGTNKRLIQCPDVMQTCLETCEKKYESCPHTCSEKCHKGKCPPCQVLVRKRCSCFAHMKSLPCNKVFRCDTKCKLPRDCARHPCGRKCCDGNCPPCDKACDKPLRCGRHKCTALCHQGRCYPCPVESKIFCKCKQTYVSVPCGREKYAKPPKCSLPCKVKYICGHSEENKHTCHFGDCPLCKATCNETYPKCGHKCKAKCHKYVAVILKQVEKPATPWEVQPPKTKMMALKCPPCSMPTTVVCFGEHETDEQPCHTATRRPCGRDCGKPLACGNHKCTSMCHLYKPDPNYPDVPHLCKPCNLECIKPRPERCCHKCSIGSCHPGACPPCNIVERIPCHCKITELYLHCNEYCTATEEMLSCKQQCPKNLECGHRCKNICHSGDCGNQLCTKKTKVYCPCGNIKKEAPCNAVKSGEVKIMCNETCELKKAAAKVELEREQQRFKLLEEERNRKELAEYEWKLSGKKKKYKEKKVLINKDERSWLRRQWIPVLSTFLVILAASCYIVNV